MLETILIVAGAALAGQIIVSTVDWLVNDVILSPRTRQTQVKPAINEELLRPKDREMIARSQEIFRGVLGEDMIASVKAKSADERIETIAPLVEQLAAAYGLNGIKLRLFREKSGFCGSYNRSNQELSLNVQYLLCDDPRAIREFYDTILHELRHAVQAQMIRQPGFWDADQELRARLAHNFNHYIRSDRDPQGYMNQLIESDAFTFAYVTMEGLCHA